MNRELLPAVLMFFQRSSSLRTAKARTTTPIAVTTTLGRYHVNRNNFLTTPFLLRCRRRKRSNHTVRCPPRPDSPPAYTHNPQPLSTRPNPSQKKSLHALHPTVIQSRSTV